MKTKILLICSIILLLMSTNTIAQFQNYVVAGFPFGRTIPVNNGIGIGNFPAGVPPNSALHINSNFLPVNMFFNRGDVFRTDGPSNLNNAWRLWTGGEPGGPIASEKFVIRVPANTNNAFLQTTQNGHLYFNTNSINRMRINGTLSATVFNSINTNVSGFVGIAPGGWFQNVNNTPWSMLHLQGPNISGFSGAGWRTWMRTGAFMMENSDAMYVGMQQFPVSITAAMPS